MMSFTNITSEHLKAVTRKISEKGEDIVMSTAMKLREEGKLEGRLEGKLEGINEGITKAKIETARAMLKNGFSIDSISKYTGLSEKDISSIK